MKAFERLLSRLTDISAIVGGLAMVVMMLQVTADVLGKYILNHPVPATLETVSSYYMVALVFLPLGFVTKHHEHIIVELFTQGLSPRPLSFFTGLANVLAAAYVFTLAWRGMDEAIYMTGIRESWETSIWDMQVWPSRWFVPIGCGLMFLYMLIHAIDDFAYLFTGRRLITAGKQVKTIAEH
jgi:TRAP-type C4-dicarboxylate transport system permease small subunit